LAELSVSGQCASDLEELPVPVIWQNNLHVEELANDLAELPVPVIWQNCLYVEEHASDLAELPACGGACH
jgi:hypothetical protein